MNKIIYVIAAVVAVGLVSVTVFMYADIDLKGYIAYPNDVTAVIPHEIASTNNAFAVDFYKQVSQGNAENHFFSPASMYIAFSILYEGAQNNTATQIADVFGFDPDALTRHNSTAQLMASINRDDPHATLDMANALWVAERFEPFESYIDTARQTYRADIERVSFTATDNEGNKVSIKKINQWASDNTNGKITEVLKSDDVSHRTVMVINNAIYFKGTWVTQFDPTDTEKSDFWTNQTHSVKADFMNQQGMFDYVHFGGVKVLKMPYEGDRLSMLVILPDDRDGIDALGESLSADMIEQWREQLRETEVVVSVPKFTMKTHYDLIDPLTNMGITDVFIDFESDLWGIADTYPRHLYVTKAVQDAFVDVNEEGTEAAAVTTVVVYVDSMPEPPPQFTADHPFIFLIQDDESGTILFMGKVADPTKPSR